MSVHEDLLAMGFDPQAIEWAVSNTNGSIEQCIDWIGSHDDQGVDQGPVINRPAVDLQEQLRARKELAAKKRAEEEKQQRIARLKISQHQAEEDRIRQDLQIEQAKKDAAARKREVVQEREYRDLLRKRIAQDRLEREAREREAQRLRRGEAPEQAAPQTIPVVPAVASVTTDSRPPPPTSIRMRIKYEQKTLTKAVRPELTVEDLGEELAPELGLAPGTFELETAYPKSTVAVVGNVETVVAAGLSNASLTVVLL